MDKHEIAEWRQRALKAEAALAEAKADARLHACAYVGTCDGAECGRNLAQRKIRDLQAKLAEAQICTNGEEPCRPLSDLQAKLAAALEGWDNLHKQFDADQHRIASLEAALCRYCNSRECEFVGLKCAQGIKRRRS